MIYVTGDMHGDISRFEDKNIAKLRRGDYLIICGDFGFIWDGSRQEEKVLKFLSRQKFTILFVDGCHENVALHVAVGKVSLVELPGDLLHIRVQRGFPRHGHEPAYVCRKRSCLGGILDRNLHSSSPSSSGSVAGVKSASIMSSCSFSMV